MRHSARVSTNKIIAISFILLGTLVFLCLVIIIYMAHNNSKLQDSKQVIVTPMTYDAPFTVSGNEASPQNRLMWALSFISLRLNVSPASVDAQHQLILFYIKPGAQKELEVTLAEEARRIKQSNITSVFYQTDYKVYPNSSLVEVTGTLHTWIGNSKPEKELKRYILEMEYNNGVNNLKRFMEPENEKK